MVGGHCIPVDPYYLYYAAKKKKLEASFLLSGRNVNNNMEKFVLNKIYSEIKKIKKRNTKILVAGICYKAEVSDIRNSLPLDKIFIFCFGFILPLITLTNTTTPK